MNYENNDHQHSEYVRPSKKYRCGRASRWGKPCWQGPDENKKCGGSSDCSPVRRGDRYYCQRPKSAGGECHEGPLPDGVCAHTYLPCRPRVSIRGLRRKLSLFGVLIIVILLSLFSSRDNGIVYNEMINPGALSSSHAGFPTSNQCENCHQAHAQSASTWFMAAFEHNDMTQQCVKCHAFDGEEKSPHNRQFEDKQDETLECVSCHSEHNGSAFSISDVSNQTCSNCHEQSFAKLSEHAAIQTNYPHQQPSSIFFDHAKHLSEYFVEDKWLNKPGRDAELAKKAVSGCQYCHQVENAQREVPIRDYEDSCSGCHDQQITQRTMTILTTDEISPVLMAMFSGAASDQDEELDVDEFTVQLINDMANDGMQAISKKLNEAGVELVEQQQLFMGLNSKLLKRTARQWLNEEDMDADDAQPGWHAAENDDGAEAVFYRANGHADKTMRLWLEFYLRKAKVKNNTQAEELLLELLDTEDGPGACGKCHGSIAGNSAQQPSQQKPSLLWGKTAIQERQYTPGFTHRPHIDLLGKSHGCDACHKLSDDADYPAYFKQSGTDAELFQSNFSGIKLETCVQCHNSKRVSDDCQLCHVYHSGAGFKFEHQKREMKVINHE